VVRISGESAHPPASNLDERDFYHEDLLTLALEATEPTDGPFIITHFNHRVPRKRGLEELISGKRINVYVAATRNEWEKNLLAVRIPIYKGLLSYRLFLINQQAKSRFAAIHTLADLKKLRAGSGAQWTITMTLQKGGFTVVPGTDYEGLFSMLSMNRFDYFPRGLNEIYPELKARKNRFPNMCVEPTLALYCPLPTYFFVSPQAPGLADRIKRGLEILIANGSFDAVFHRWFDSDIEQAQLAGRRVLRVGNPFLSKKTPLNRPELWLKTGGLTLPKQ
jgi:ABC-type amino acid transport substrate-binding protein